MQELSDRPLVIRADEVFLLVLLSGAVKVGGCRSERASSVKYVRRIVWLRNGFALGR